MTDVEKVLPFCGYEQPLGDGEWIHPETNDVRCTKPGCDLSLDLEFIFRTLIPALRDRLLFGYVQYWTVEDDDHGVALESGEHGTVDGTGPTFEAAFLAAAAKAVSDE